MPGTVTRRFRVHNSEQFHEAFSEAAATNMYLFIGRVSAWDDDNNPPTPGDSVYNVDYASWQSMIAAKKVAPGDVTFAIPRYNWTSGKVYREYKNTDGSLHDTPASSNTLYVLSSSYNVYKCLFNNKGAASTVEPSGSATSTLVTADGYHWKYMYTIDAGDALKYLTSAWMPVSTLTADDGSAQWDVQQAAANGAIDIIDVDAGGASYETDTGTLAAVSNSTVITLGASASGADDIYSGSSVYIDAGLGSGQVRAISNYVGSTKVATLSTAFAVTPNTSSTYVLGPTITVNGDGSGAEAYANVASGAVNYISMVSTGSGYSSANVAITANSSHGSGATATPYVAPQSGHGVDAVNELAGHNVVLNVQLDGAESNTFPTVNDFRVIGVMSNPLLANGSAANSSTYDQTTQLTVSGVSGSGAFTADEKVRDDSSGATGKLLSFANTNAANTTGIVRVIDDSANGDFAATDTFTGLTSGITGTIDTVGTKSLLPYSGDVLYVENRAPISRASDQIEDIKLVVKF